MGEIMFYAMQAIITALIALNSGFNSADGIFDTLMNMEIPNVVDSAVTAIGVSLASAFFAMEFFSKLAEFRMEGIESAIRIGMKIVVAKVIIENTANISAGIYDLFGALGKESFGTSISRYLTIIIGSLNRGTVDLVEQMDTNAFKSFMNMGSVLQWIGYVAVLAIVFALLCNIAFTVVGVVFEVAIHQATAPIAISTLVNEITRSTGISFIKSYSAVCLQFLVIKVIFQVGAELADSINDMFDFGSPASGESGEILLHAVLSCLPAVLGLFMITAAVKKSGEITKRLFGA